MRSPLFSLMMLLAMLLLAIALVCRAQPASPATASPAAGPAPTGAGAGAGARNAPPDTRPLQEVDPAVAAFLKPVEAAAGDDELRQKLKQRHNTAVRLLGLRVE